MAVPLTRCATAVAAAHRLPARTGLATAIALAWVGLWPQATQAQTAAPPAAAASAAAARPSPAPAANAAPVSTPAAAPRAAPQRVEITGTQDKTDPTLDERRRATASRIVIGREELDRMGDSSVGEVLKRLPGVTMGGPPGRGSGPRMRGMGGGYTLILIDGQRMPPGFSLDNIPPEQIERIEVMRAPVAEYSTRAIAGTINVIMRADFKRKANDLRAGLQADGPRVGLGGNWQRNGQTDDLGWSTSVAMMHGGQNSETDTRITGGLDDEGAPVANQTSSVRSRGTRSALFANARLQFKLGQGRTLDVQPFVSLSHGQQDSHILRSVDAGSGSTGAAQAYTQADSRGESDSGMFRLNTTYNTPLSSGGRLTASLAAMAAESKNGSTRFETGGTAGSAGRLREDDSRSRDLSLDHKGKLAQLLGERHSMSAGWELQHNRRRDWQEKRIDGVLDLNPYGDTVDATITRAALFAQDEWEWSKQLSFYLGARWEGIETEGRTSLGTTRNRSSVLTPLAHLVYKLEENARDQVRASLTRSYRSPDTRQLIGQLTRTTLYDANVTNDPLAPDRLGNPNLKPELAWSLELGYEHYLEGGILSVNGYLKRIDNLIRNVVRGPQAVAWSTAPRYVSTPENIGRADTAGLEFEAKARAQDLWATELPLSLRANLSLMWARVSAVPGPDNRLADMPPWTLNLGGDLPLRGTPLTVGGSWSYTPHFQVRQIDDLLTRQGVKNGLDVYALWRIGPEASVRLTVNNLLARRYDTGSTRFNDDSFSSLYQDSQSQTRTYRNVSLRAELKF